MDKYVCGIMISYDLDSFLLIDKGGMVTNENSILKCQGIGGKIKPPFESPHEAMVREFSEEVGHKIQTNRWHCFLIKQHGYTKIYYFTCFASMSEMIQCVLKSKEIKKPEGVINIHSIADVLFDTNEYTFDMPYLIPMIIREMNAGMFMKLDPEGINTNGKAL